MLIKVIFVYLVKIYTGRSYILPYITMIPNKER